MKYIIENTPKDEKETFIHIDKLDKTCCLYTTDSTIYKKMEKQLGIPTKIFPPTVELQKSEYISGASWTFHYNNDERKKVKKMFNITNLLPRIKDNN